MSAGVVVDSSTGGYLVPEGAPPLYDLDLDLVFQALVVGVTGLQGSLVRPRTQPKTPPRPEIDVTWCAVGVESIEPENSASGYYDATADGGQGAQIQTLHERLAVRASFYGPGGQFQAMQFRHGILVEQNREALRLAGMGYVRSGEVRSAPTLVNNLPQRKYDVTLEVNRAVVREYPIRPLLAALGQIYGGGRVDVTFDTRNSRIQPRGN